MSGKKVFERDRFANSRYITPATARYWRVELLDEVVSTQLEFSERLAVTDANRVVVAEYQSHGRGRFDRTFESRRSLGLTFSLALLPSRQRSEWSWLPLLVGSAIADSLNNQLFSAKVIETKWPNDIVDSSGRKFGGILTELRGDGLVVGIGINVLEVGDELAVPHAISLAMVSSRVRTGEISREDILAIILDGIRQRYEYWVAHGADERELSRYRESSLTLGENKERLVRCELPGGKVIEGKVQDIKSDGHLLVEDDHQLHDIHVGDVIHLR